MSLPVFANRMKSKEDFSRLKKKLESKNSFRGFLCSKRGPAQLRPQGLHSVPQHPAFRDFSHVPEHVWSISTHVVHVLEGCVLR